MIRDAIENKRDIWMIYFTYSSRKFTDRVVTPLEVRQDYGKVYLRAYCHLRKDERTFKVARIKEFREVTRASAGE